MPAKEHREEGSSVRVAVQATCSGYLETKVLAVVASASPSGVAHVAVRVDRMLIYVTDAAALASFVKAWQEAGVLGEQVFRSEATEDSFDWAERHAHRRFEKTGRIDKPRE